MNRVVLALEQPEYSALLRISNQELRSPSDQAKYLLLNELGRRGLVVREALAGAQRSDEESKPDALE